MYLELKEAFSTNVAADEVFTIIDQWKKKRIRGHLYSYHTIFNLGSNIKAKDEKFGSYNIVASKKNNRSFK